MNNPMQFPALSRTLVAVAVVGFTLLASGCDKYTASGQTVGQKVDKAIDNTNARVAAANEKVEQKVDAAGAAINRAGDAVSTKVDQVGVIVDDSAITASIKTDLLKDPGLSALRVDVNTVRGEVTLKGEAPTEAGKQRAEAISKQIVGVTKVTNQLRVTGK